MIITYWLSEWQKYSRSVSRPYTEDFHYADGYKVVSYSLKTLA